MERALMIDEIEIIMVFPNVIISEDLQLKDLSSAWGRWDVVCRCISATKLLSDQTSVSFIGIFSHQNDWIVLRINPDDWNQWSLSEIDIADHIKENFLSLKKFTKLQDEIMFDQQNAKDRNVIVFLTESGQDIIEALPHLQENQKLQVILGNEEGIPSLLKQWTANQQIKEISFGSRSYLASHCITLLNYTLTYP